MTAVVETDTKVGDDVRVAHLVDDFYFFDEVSDALPLSAFAAEALDGDLGAHPLSLEDFSIATAAQKVRLVVEFEFVSLNIEVKAIPVECFDEEIILIRVDFVLERGGLVTLSFLV